MKIELPDRYSPYQKRVLRAMIRAQVSPWALAGAWWFNRPLTDLPRPYRGKLPPPPSPEPPPYVAKAWRMSQALGGVTRNHAALLVSCLLWEKLFPQDFPEFGVTKMCAALDLESVADNDSAWVQANIVDNASPMRAWTFNASARDCVRIASGET